MPDETFQQSGERLLRALQIDWDKDKFDRLHRMIDYAIKRQDWYEDQRNKTLALALALLGLSSFLVAGLLNAPVEMILFRISAGFTLLSVVVTALIIINEYARGAQLQYTHRSLADIRSWYYAYILKAPVVEAAVEDQARAQQNRKTLSDAWVAFLEGWTEYASDPKKMATEDLQQVFILFLFQALRRNSLRIMLEQATRGGRVTAIFLLLTILCAALRI